MEQSQIIDDLVTTGPAAREADGVTARSAKAAWGRCIELWAHDQSVQGHWADACRSRRPIAQRTVRPYRVVLATPSFNQDLCFRQGVEDLAVE